MHIPLYDCGRFVSKTGYIYHGRPLRMLMALVALNVIRIRVYHNIRNIRLDSTLP